MVRGDFIMEKKELVYEGKAKKFITPIMMIFIGLSIKMMLPHLMVKKGTIVGKGELNNRISSIFFEKLVEQGIPNHFVKLLSPTEQLVKKVRIIPLEVVVRNIAAGSLAKRLGLEEGTELRHAVVEFYYKDDELGDPLINSSHISVLQLATPKQIEEMKASSLQVNQVLTQYLKEREVILVDYKLEFGLTTDGTLLLADEISPDTCRFWDANTKEKLDKDRFRRDLGNVEEAYQEILKRLGERFMYKARVYVTLKNGILDPQGKAVKGSLQSLGYDEVQDVRVGKFIELQVNTQQKEVAEERIKEMCEKLLANLVIEDYQFQIEEVAS